MREEIEAAALFITKLVNKNLTAVGANQHHQQCGSSASSIHSSASSTTSSSASSTSSNSESPPGFVDVDHSTQSSIGSDLSATSDQQQQLHQHQQQQQQQEATTTNKVEQFRQCLTQALYERFHNHWFPDQPTKGQAYRCIRLNEWDRHDTTLQKACIQCGIDYKDLQLPVELTLWVDPDEVTCRFGENKGSHCLVAKFKDGELKDNNFNIDINSIDIEIFQQATNNNNTININNNNIHQHQHHHSNSPRQHSLLGSPDYQKHQNQQHNHNQQHHQQGNHNSSYHFLHQNNNNNNHHHHQHHQQAQPPIHHRSQNIGKTATMFPSYQQNYLNGCDNNVENSSLILRNLLQNTTAAAAACAA